MSRRSPIAHVLAVLLGAALIPMALADTVRLKTSVRLPAGAETVRLADVADLEGADAEKFADLVVSPIRHIDTATEITVRVVRQVLDDAGVHWGRVNLTGNKVVVRPPSRLAAAAPVPMTGASLVETPRDRREPRDARRSSDGMIVSTLLDAPTLRGTIARRFANDLGVHPDRVRLLFDGADAERLDRNDARVTWECRFEGNPKSDRVMITVRGWSDGLIADSAHVSVRPQLLTPIVVLARDLRRDEPLTNTDVSSDETWLPPSQAALVARRQDISGRFTLKTMRTGTTLRRQHLRSATLIDRGDRVIVRCMVGGIVLSLQAEARADGAAGETIEFQKLGERNTFLATVTERGEAVFDLGL